jgi:hypothetical protein
MWNADGALGYLASGIRPPLVTLPGRPNLPAFLVSKYGMRNALWDGHPASDRLERGTTIF